MTNRKGTKNITVFDVAEAAGVSKSTVSLVLTGSDKVSDKAKKKVQKAITSTGYIYNRDAASLRSRKSNLIAIVINDLTNPYAAQLAIGLEQEIRKIGFFSILVNSDECIETQNQLVNKLKEYNVAAFIICPAPGTSAKWTNDLVDKGFFVIFIMRKIKDAHVPTVMPNNIVGTKIATEHLITLGHRKIAFLGGNESISDYHERLAGYTKSMNSLNTPFKKNYCIQSKTTRNGGREAMTRLLKIQPDIQAIVCFNDVVAYGAIEIMRLNGINPGKDIAIVGFDDLKDSKLMSPSLSTVCIDANEIGKAVCHILINSKNTNNEHLLIDVEFIERESSGSIINII